MTALPAHMEMGTGAALVFLHGIGGDKTSFQHQLPAFAGAWRAISWDMPGYGESPLEEDMSFEMLSRSLAALLDHLDVDQAHIVGHSMGGMVAQQFVADFPDRVQAQVLSATSPAFGKPGGAWQKQFLAERLAPLDRGLTPADFADELMAGMFGDFKSSDRQAEAAASMKRLKSDTYRAALNCLVTFDRRAALAAISCPTLCLAGEKDGAAPPAVMEKMASKISGAEYQCISSVGHLANFERADLFNAAIERFLSQTSAKEA